MDEKKLKAKVHNLNNKPIYFPGLNGLRAIAALAVVTAHITISLNEFNLSPFDLAIFKQGLPPGIYLGSYAVSIFFALSGFLITYLLQDEKEQGGISVRKFYIRRILRIWPLYYLYLVIALALIIYCNLGIDKTSLILILCFSMNVPGMFGAQLPFLSHYWSLSIEEQFYLFWPWVIKKVKKLLPVLCIAIIVLNLAKLFVHIYIKNSNADLLLLTTRFDCMMIGAIGALLFKRDDHRFMRLANNRIAQAICWIIIALSAINKFHLASVIDHQVIAVVTTVIIIGQVKIKNRLVNLETRLFNFIGKISYGIYVIHPLAILLFVKLLGHYTMNRPTKYILVYSGVTATTILLASLSYFLFEKKFLQIKKKFSVAQRSSMSAYP